MVCGIESGEVVIIMSRGDISSVEKWVIRGGVRAAVTLGVSVESGHVSDPDGIVCL